MIFGKRTEVSTVIAKNVMVMQKAEVLINKILTARKYNNNKTDTSALEREIDNLVHKLYDLTPAEINIIEGNIKKEEI
jgi:hypothetical protein